MYPSSLAKTSIGTHFICHFNVATNITTLHDSLDYQYCYLLLHSTLPYHGLHVTRSSILQNTGLCCVMKSILYFMEADESKCTNKGKESVYPQEITHRLGGSAKGYSQCIWVQSWSLSLLTSISQDIASRQREFSQYPPRHSLRQHEKPPSRPLSMNSRYPYSHSSIHTNEYHTSLRASNKNHGTQKGAKVQDTSEQSGVKLLQIG